MRRSKQSFCSLVVGLFMIVGFSGFVLAGSSDWYPSRYGPDDTIGSLNEITAQKTLNAIRSVEKGKIYDLAVDLENGMPTMENLQGIFSHSKFLTYEDSLRMLGAHSENNIGVNICRNEIPEHNGTHVDALNHISIGNRLYNGLRIEDVSTMYGTSKLGMETMPPILTRGVLLDMAAYKGVETMEAGYVITPEDIEGCLKKQGTEIKPGDAVLFRTGWIHLWMKDNHKYAHGGEPGPGLASAKWLTDRRVAAVGADNLGVEVLPNPNRKLLFPCHQHFITKNGVAIIENLTLDELAKDKVYEFLFIALSLRIKGGSGSQIRPVAVK